MMIAHPPNHPAMLLQQITAKNTINRAIKPNEMKYSPFINMRLNIKALIMRRGHFSAALLQEIKVNNLRMTLMPSKDSSLCL